MESVKRDRQQVMLQECTHQPRINDISRIIAKRPQEPIGEHLTKVAKQYRERKEVARNETIKHQESSCSFAP